MQREKTVAYAHAFQYWAEKADLPTGGQPHLLAESVKELWNEMRCYLSFSDKELFKGVTPPEEMSSSLAKKPKPHSTTATPAIASKEQVARKTSQELLNSWMGKSAAPIPACDGYWAASSPVKKPRADLSTCGQL